MPFSQRMTQRRKLVCKMFASMRFKESESGTIKEEAKQYLRIVSPSSDDYMKLSLYERKAEPDANERAVRMCVKFFQSRDT